VVIHIPVGSLATIRSDTAIAYNYLQEESSGWYSLFVQPGRFILASSWTPLHRRLVGINISDPEGHGLALPLLIRLAFDQPPIIIVDICLEFACGHESMYPGERAAQPFGRALGIEHLHPSHEQPL